MISRKLYYSCIFLFFSLSFYTQKQLEDELTYNQIEKRIDNSHNDSIELWKMINLYISKAKNEKNSDGLVYAYRYASNFSSDPINIKFADSALIVSKNAENIRLLANAFLNRGVVYMSNAQYEQSLDDILTANEYANLIGNDYVVYKSKYLITQNKIYLGLYEEANKELNEIVSFFRNHLTDSSLGKDYEMYYLYTLMSIIDTNEKLGKVSENKKILSEAYQYIKSNKLKHYLPYFISLEGTDAYYNKNYTKAIKNLTTALKSYEDQWNHISEVYYLGKSYWNLGKQNIAVKYFEKIDKEFNKEKKLDPQFRNAYELLIKYNDSLGNTDRQLEYINKLIDLDRSYEKNYKYLYTNIHKKYDTRELIQQKKKIENELKIKSIIVSLLIVITIVVIIFFVYRSYRIQKLYEKRFEELISQKNEKLLNKHENPTEIDNKSLFEAKKQEEPGYYSKIQGINPQVVENVLAELENFEQSEGFLNTQITQKMLSDEFGTNSTYLSKIINNYKGKNFNIYINDLRLEYILNLLKTDYEYLDKDVKELAQLCAFTSTESFSDNFQRKFNLKPSYFIKKMRDVKRASQPLNSYNSKETDIENKE